MTDAPAYGRRSDAQLVADFGVAMREEREWRGWSQEELVRQIARLPASIRFGAPPDAAAIIALEAGEGKRLPAWVRLVRMAFERERLPEARHGEWLNARQWYRPGYVPGDPGDMACPWVLRDEFLHLERLSFLPDEDRALVFRLARALVDRDEAVLVKVGEQIGERLAA